MGENQQLRKWQLSATAAPKFVAQSRDFASADVRGNAPGGMPGGFCAGSSNGKDPTRTCWYVPFPAVTRMQIWYKAILKFSILYTSEIRVFGKTLGLRQLGLVGSTGGCKI